MFVKALELSHHPGYERLIDVSQQGVHRRWGVSSVVLDPTSQEWIELLGDVLQRQLCLMAKFQFPNRRLHGFHRRGANCGIKSAGQTLNKNAVAVMPKNQLSWYNSVIA